MKSHFLALLLGLIFSVSFVLPYQVQYLGDDGSIHSYYVSLLFHQIVSHMPNPGSFDNHLYYGWGFLQVYPPLFTILATSLMFFTPYAIKLLELLLFPLVSLAAFSFFRRLFPSDFIALVSSILYMSSPFIVTSFVQLGTPDYLLAFLFTPLIFRQLLQTRFTSVFSNLRHIIITSALLALLFLATPNTWLTMLPYFLLFSFLQLSTSLVTRLRAFAFLTLSLVFALPYSYTSVLFFLQHPPLYQTIKPDLDILSFLFSPVGVGVGFLIFATSLFGLIVVFHSKIYSPFVPLYLISVALFLLPPIPVVSFYQGVSVTFPLILSGSVLGTYLFNLRVLNSRYTRFLTFSFLLLLLLISMASIRVYPSSENQYLPLFNAGSTLVLQCSCHPRVILLPRSPIIGWLTFKMNTTSPDGWFDQGSPENLTNFHVATSTYVCTNMPEAVSVFRSYDVQYIIFSKYIYYAPQVCSNTVLLSNLMSYTNLVYSNQTGGVYVFKV